MSSRHKSNLECRDLKKCSNYKQRKLKYNCIFEDVDIFYGFTHFLQF
ncbi:hypothetical protein KLPMCP352M_25935 [Klebsiella pneumoniae]